jgi:23S rRNA pseudouridine1911/1915/1917 synthase
VADRTINCNDKDARRTIAELLRRWEKLTWGGAERRLRQRRVLINNTLCTDPARRPNEGDTVKLLEHPAAAAPTADKLDMVYMDDCVVVVNKPPAVTSTRHRDEKAPSNRGRKVRKQLQPTLDEMVNQLLDGLDDGLRPARAVHRLDRDTSGLMVFARSGPSERHLINQFRHHTIERSYLAVVHGHPTAQTIDLPLVRDPKTQRRGTLADDTPDKQRRLAQKAVTHLKPLEAVGEYHVVACRLETGRTHQIRLHCAALGHPLCGDKLYGPPADSSNAPRQALHASRLGFEHPARHTPMRYESDWPTDLKRWLDRLA